MPRRVGVSASKREAWPGIKRLTLYWKTRRWPVNKCSCPHTSPRGTSLALNESTFCKESAVNDWMIFASDFRWVRIFVTLQEFRSGSFSPDSWFSWFWLKTISFWWLIKRLLEFLGRTSNTIFCLVSFLSTHRERGRPQKEWPNNKASISHLYCMQTGFSGWREPTLFFIGYWLANIGLERKAHIRLLFDEICQERGGNYWFGGLTG